MRMILSSSRWASAWMASKISGSTCCSADMTGLSGSVAEATFEFRDLLDAARVAAAVERGVEPRPDDGQPPLGIEPALAEHQDVGVVVRPAGFRDLRIGAQRGAYARKLVRDDRHADAGTADQDSPVGPALRDGFGHLGAVVGVVDRVAPVRPQVFVGHL